MADGNAVRAWAEYAAALKAFLARAEADPDDLISKGDLGAAHYRLAVAVERLARVLPAATAWVGPVQSAAHYAECLRLRTALAAADPKDTQGQINLLMAQARAGRVAEAVKTADGLLKQAGKDRRVLFQAACGLAVVAGTPDPVAARCRDRALGILDSLVASGWQDRVGLQTDPDLDAVRGDPRFAGLLARIPK